MIEANRFPIFEVAVQQYIEHGYLSQSTFMQLSAEERMEAFAEAERRAD